jgi:hypothetical protein
MNNLHSIQLSSQIIYTQNLCEKQKKQSCYPKKRRDMTCNQKSAKLSNNARLSSADNNPGHSNEMNALKQKKSKDAFYKQIIKSYWTHEPWLYFNVVEKSKELMGDYITLHGLVPQNELPIHMRNKIPANEIWMREDIYSDIERRKRILTHEYVELELMITHNMTYREAHVQAEYFEDIWYGSVRVH